ncbi:Importin-11 [Fulvia fulva]|uniref:Importin-11 n=1 Tax=Passalora fulva TaxID=5499 RepID=A0A9Q8LF11_PASFU|nr:Importin-11 [Fulvia fulva]KAK4626424.1 Importin-11 [Fulvia fulva]UJO16195.1 Importin-11 [Fulvia fulva]WPV13504.1 Importin-11 [Fulvia fulva]WPV28913.1 Importin-11 [Fulvia fulva]
MPSFTIEVPGEANPLSTENIVSTLQAASSSHPNQIQTGTKQLAQWEKEPGYYRGLQEAYLTTALPIEVRYLAIIQLKNGIDKYWRKTATNAVSSSDKQVIRGWLLEGALGQEDRRLALQAALVVAKIARYEYPNDWPAAISCFLDAMRGPGMTPVRSRNALLTLLHIIKELSTGRLQRTRQYLQAATPEILAVVGGIYARTVDAWQHKPTAEDMEYGLLAIKALRRLLIFGYEHPNRDADVVSFWTLTLHHLSSFISLPSASNSGLPQEAVVLLGKHTVQLAKLHHEMARDHPAAFALLPNSLELTSSYWSLVKEFGNVFGSKEATVAASRSTQIGTDGDASDDKPFTEKIALKGLLLIRACVKMVHNPTQTFKYKTPEDKEEKKRATDVLKQTLLTESFVREAMETLVTKFFVFRASDLREWQEEPEEWEKREEGDGEDWEFSVRSCSEKLFLDLAINYKDIIVQPLLSVLYSVANQQNDDVLFKDSVYTAIGLSAAVVHEQLDFDAFVRDVLVVEVQKEAPGYNILRRRASILLAQWIPIKISDESKPLVYQIFQHLLNPDDQLNDQVVRVTAGRQFLNIANDWEFKPEQFLPYAQTVLTQLMQLIGEVELTDTKMALLNTISALVERLDSHITPFAERIVSLLPGLWEDSGEEHLMKQAVLTVLARLVNAMKGDSLPLHPLVFPIIKGAVEPGSETQVYLLEDALELWGAVLVQTPTDSASPQLLDLVQYLYPLYELGSDGLRKALEITESYFILAPQHMLSAPVRPAMFIALSKLMGSLRPEANGSVCTLLETILRYSQSPDVASTLPLGNFNDASFMIMYELAQASDPETGDVGLFPKLIRALRGSYLAHCTTGPNAKEATVAGIVETDYFAIFARAILCSLDGFMHTLQYSASVAFSEQQPLEALMKWLLEEWFSHFENIGDPSRRKLMCLALTKLLETGQPFILMSLQSLMTTWTDVVTELREDAADVGGDSLVRSGPSNGYTDGPEAPEDVRRRLLADSDQVHSINLPEWIKHYLQQTIAASGGYEQFRAQWLVNVDQDVVKGFSALGII